MTWFGLVTALLAAGPATTVAIDASGPCAPREVLQRELRRAPVRFVDEDAELTIRLDVESAGYRLRVSDADGLVMMERALPTPSCDEAAVAAALIIDRALRDIVVRLPPPDDAGVRTRRKKVTPKPPEPPKGNEPAGAAPDAGQPRDAQATLSPPAPTARPPTETATRRTRDTSRPPAPRTSEPPAPLATASPRPPTEAARPTETPPIPPPPRPTPVETTRPAETPPIPPPPRPTETTRPAETPPIPPPRPAPTETTRPTETPPVPPPTPPAAPPPPLPITSFAQGEFPPATPRLFIAPRDVEPPEAFVLAPRRLHFELTAGGGLATPTPSTVSLLLTLDGALRLPSVWRFGLLGAFSFGGSTPVIDEQGRTRGTLSSQTLFLLPHAMACLDTTVELCGGVRAGARLAAGTAAGPFLFQTRTAFAPAPTAGLGARAAFAVGPVVLALDVTGLVNLTTPALGVEGLTASIETPRLELLLHLSAGGRSR